MRIVLIIWLFLISCKGYSQVYSTVDGVVSFISDAPLEIIKASSDQLQGVLDVSNRTFAFRIYIKSFDGFNNPLQKEHFNENYLEVSDYPISVFKGKILENIVEGKAKYRAKGVFEIHGVEVERIIDVSLELLDDEVKFYAIFEVPLVDHDISLPRIVYQKIAEIILVTVEGSLNIRK